MNTEIEKLGWYENNPQKTVELIEQCNLPKEASLFIPGAGATTLVDELVNRDFSNIIANDISEAALIKLKERVGKTNAVTYIIDDLTKPRKLPQIDKIDLWIDRAVLHFFLTEEEQNAYFVLVKKLVKMKGYIILAEFNLEGAKKCSGLDVVNYNEAMLQQKLGEEFNLINSFNYTYVNPSGGERPYVYTLFQRK
ncbi:MAG: methyltransferase domain-containing protein [Flavobacteriaceae bacterium]|nr:methyltransferase domain-containing protein [Flavobacteriaceae bacterium]